MEDYYIWDRYKCKECRKEIDRERYPKRKDYLRNYWINWYSRPENQKSHSKNSQRFSRIWNSKNKEKKRTGDLLRRAVRLGKITRPDICSSCHQHNKIEAHHPDYTKPYDVIWLCRSCHKLLELKTSIQ